jgi:hypothetical protein
MFFNVDDTTMAAGISNPTGSSGMFKMYAAAELLMSFVLMMNGLLPCTHRVLPG